jgi:hypothetical protein
MTRMALVGLSLLGCGSDLTGEGTFVERCAGLYDAELTPIATRPLAP